MRKPEEKKSSMGAGATSLWRNRDFNLALLGISASMLGDSILITGILWWVLTETGSATSMSILTAVSTIIIMVLSPLGGVWLDTEDRQKIMVGTDLFRAAVLVVFLLYTLIDPTFSWSAILVVVALLAVGSSLFVPATGSVMPNLVPPEVLSQANSTLFAARNLARLSGPVLAGILLPLFGLQSVVILDAATFLVSAACLALIRQPFTKVQLSSKPKFRVAFAEGFKYLRENQVLKAYVVVAAVINVGISLFTLTIPIVVQRVLNGGAELYGLLQGAFQAGMFAAGVLLGVFGLARLIPNNSVAIAFALMFMALAQGPFGWFSSRGVAMALAFAAGGGLILTSTLADTRLELSLPDRLRSRGYGLAISLVNGLRPAGVLIGGVLADAVSVGAVTALSALLIGTTALYVLVVRALDDPSSKFQGNKVQS